MLGALFREFRLPGIRLRWVRKATLIVRRISRRLLESHRGLYAKASKKGGTDLRDDGEIQQVGL